MSGWGEGHTQFRISELLSHFFFSLGLEGTWCYCTLLLGMPRTGWIVKLLFWRELYSTLFVLMPLSKANNDILRSWGGKVLLSPHTGYMKSDYFLLKRARRANVSLLRDCHEQKFTLWSFKNHHILCTSTLQLQPGLALFLGFSYGLKTIPQPKILLFFFVFRHMLLEYKDFWGGHIFYFDSRATFWSPWLFIPVYLLIAVFPG